MTTLLVGLAVAVYVIGFLWTWRTAAWVVASDGLYTDGRKPSGDDVAFGMFAGLCIATVWPVVAPLYMLYTRSTSHGAGFLRRPAHVRRRMEQDEREAQLRERERRIRHLEQDLGLPPIDEP